MNLTIDGGLAKRFLNEVGKRFGAGRGNIGKAATEAFEDWIRKGGRK
jgi:hypothetical protein